MTPEKLRSVLRSIYAETLQSIDLAELTRHFTEGLSLCRPVYVIAAGKASIAMAKGAYQALGERIARGLVVYPQGCSWSDAPCAFETLEAAHPVPDARSEKAAQAALSVAQQAAKAPLLLLISGGSSSLLCAPSPGLSLSAKQQITSALLASGAPIEDINTVRRHLSRIKGGALACASQGPVLNVIVSDVIAGTYHDVGSGPGCADPTTRQQALQALRQYLPPADARSLEPYLTETLKPFSPASARIGNHILLGPEDFAARMAGALEKKGFFCQSKRLLHLSAEELARQLCLEAHQLEPGQGWVVSCEPEVVLGEKVGRGGRAGWVALRALRDLPEEAALLCAATDGVDGSSGAAGACVSGDLRQQIAPGPVYQALESFNDSAIHGTLRTQLQGGPTGLNLTDIYVVVRCPKD